MININRIISPRNFWTSSGRNTVLGAIALTLALLFLIVNPAYALTTLEKSIPSGWNLISIPLEPADPTPTAVFSRVPDPLDVCGYKSGNLIPCDSPSFPAIQPGRAYWVLLKRKCTLQVSGWLVNEVTHSVAIERGWNMIGSPWAVPTEWADGSISVSGPGSTLSLSEAIAEEWVNGELQEYNSPDGRYSTLHPNSAAPEPLMPWKGYLLYSNINGQLLFAPPRPNNNPPYVEIKTPTSGSEIRTLASIIGTATDTDLVQYVLEYSLADSNKYTPIAVGSSAIENATLGKFDASVLMNGLYRLRLRATDLAGYTMSTFIDLNIAGNQKPGLFSITFVDLKVPVPGMLLQVSRTYDSRNKQQGDFGYGWTSSFSDARIIENGVLGADWEGTHSGGGMGSYCIQGTRKHLVTVNLGDNETQKFECFPERPCQNFTPPEAAKLICQKLPGSKGSLLPLGDNDLLVFGSFPGPIELVNYSTLNPYDPQEYRYTTAEGAVLIIDKNTGLKKVTNPDGSVLTIERDGITHSSGRSIGFDRDADGRIYRILDPDGNFHHYTYDSNGDLSAYTDAAGNTTRFFYDANHLLTDIRDPLNRPRARNEYDDDGRLIASIDANGNRTEFSNDVTGQEQIIRDPNGGITRMVYDDFGNITLDERTVTIDEATPVIARINRVMDADANILSETDADGLAVVNEYANGQSTRTVADPGGLNLVTENAYDTAGKVVSITNPDGMVTLFDYSDDACCSDKISAVTDAAGNVMRMEYDAQGRLNKKYDALGNYTLTGYDSSGNTASVEQFDATGTLLTKETYTYDTNGRKLTETRYRTMGGAFTPLTTHYKYDLAGNILATTDPSGGVVRNYYDSANQLIAQVDALGATTTYEYDLTGLNTRINYLDGTWEAFEYDSNRNITREIDRLGRSTRYDFDELDRQIRMTYDDGTYTRTVYSPGGRTDAEVDEQGNRTDYEYDAAGRLIKTIQPEIYDASRGMNLRPVTRMEYDAAGRRTAIIDANGNRTEYVYDTLGRLSVTRYPDGATAERRYDALSHTSELIDEEGRSILHQYNALGHLARVALPPPASGKPRPVTSYTYDETGLLLTETDANGHTTTNTYDAAGNPLSKRLPLGMTERTLANVAGVALAATDFNGEVTTFQYTQGGQTGVRRRADGSEIQVTKSPTGKVTEITDASGTIRYTYNNLDFLTAVENPDGTFLRYKYDAGGNRIAMGIPSGTTTYEYDALKRLVKVTDPDGGVTQYGYDSVGNRVHTLLPNGTSTECTYNNRNRLIRLVNRHSNGQVLSSYDYTVSPSGNRTRVVENNGRTVDYKYDDLDRLIEEKIQDTGLGNKTYQYTYDPCGNRLSKIENGVETQYTYDANNRLITESKNVSLGFFRSNGAWGAIGFLSPNWWQNILGVRSLLLIFAAIYLICLIWFHRQVLDKRSDERIWVFFNPLAARLICLLLVPMILILPDITLAAHAETAQSEVAQQLSETLTYAWDNNGNLLSQTNGTQTNTYTYDSDNRMIEADIQFSTVPGGATGLVRYTYRPDGNRYEILKGSVRTRFLVDVNQPLPLVVEERTGSDLISYVHGEDLISMKRPGTGTSYYLCDGQLSTRQLAASDETITDTYCYDAFGNLLNRTGTTPNTFLYTGEQFDPNSGFTYLRARYYDMKSGRFTSRDPYNGKTQDPNSLHKYVYAYNNPVNRSDPSGLAPCTLIEVMVCFIIDAILWALDLVYKVAAWCRATSWISMASYFIFFYQFIMVVMSVAPLTGVGFQFTIKKWGPGAPWAIKELAGRYSIKLPGKKGGSPTSNFRLEITLNNGTKAGFVLDFDDIYKSRIYGGKNLILIQVYICLIEVLKIELAFRGNVPIVAAGGYIFGRSSSDPDFWKKWKWFSLSFSWTIFQHFKLGFPIVSWSTGGVSWFDGEFESETT